MVNQLRELRDRVRVFRDRRHAGEVLAHMLAGRIPAGARVLAIPAGGVPVAAVLAEALGLALDVAVVSKITPPWNTEVGYGAVAFDGRVRFDVAAEASLGVGERVAREGIEQTLAKVRHRVELLRTSAGPLLPPGGTAVLVDDGIASGLTMALAVEALQDEGAGRIVIAVPTGPASAVRLLAGSVDAIYCANVRSGRTFAVADAYEVWTDVDEAALLEILAPWRQDRQAGMPPSSATPSPAEPGARHPREDPWLSR
jgi:predicted phosphoribosyltransferase